MSALRNLVGAELPRCDLAKIEAISICCRGLWRAHRSRDGAEIRCTCSQWKHTHWLELKQLHCHSEAETQGKHVHLSFSYCPKSKCQLYHHSISTATAVVQENYFWFLAASLYSSWHWSEQFLCHPTLNIKWFAFFAAVIAEKHSSQTLIYNKQKFWKIRMRAATAFNNRIFVFVVPVYLQFELSLLFVLKKS